jgi:hypothetical protein
MIVRRYQFLHGWIGFQINSDAEHMPNLLRLGVFDEFGKILVVRRKIDTIQMTVGVYKHG